MSFFDSASLVQIPSGVKDGVLYSVKPIDGSGDLTFSRGSDIEATRVNANGYIEKAQVNLLLHSNSFDTTWVTYDTSVTGGQSGYDGTSDAWLLAVTGATGFQTIRQTVSGTGVQTFSIYAKAGTLNWIRFSFTGGTGPTNYYNIADGTLGSIGGGEASIVSVGGGWYRCSASFNGTFTELRIYPATANNNPNQSSGNIYIQDAQLNYGLVAQTYQETTTAAVVSGITDNMPRLNYDPANPTCPSLLLEPSRQNYVTHSDFIGASDWDKTGGSVTVTTNATTSPEGVVNASKLTGVGTAVTYVLTRQTITLPAADNYTMSAYFKYSNNDWVYLTFSAYDGGGGAFFNINSGTVGTVSSGCSASIQECKDGWYRCSVTAPIGASDLSGRPSVYVAYADGTTDFPSVGAAQNQAAFIYGVCVERGGYVSSLIPTYGASATRTADSASKTGISSLIGQTEGTIYWEGSRPEGSEDFSAFSVSDGSTNNEVTFRFTSEDRIEYYLRSGGGQTVGGSYTGADLNQKTKIAFAYKANDAAIYVNGTVVNLDTSVTVPVSLNSLKFARGNDSTPMIASVNQVLLFTQRLSNSDLATLTSL